MTRIILHVDMDAFFAAIEQREHPELKGKPVIIGADPREGHGRGVVSTCSYEARKFGVHSAMPISHAYRLCPHGIYLPPNGKLYQQVSQNIFNILYEFSDLVEPVSIDEAFLDVTGSQRLYGDGPTIAQKIKQRIKEKEQLTASIGVAPNKYLAKIASDLEKPDGLVVVEPGKIEEFLWPLDISRLWGAGQRTQQILRKMGINTIGQLAQYPAEILKQKLGSAGEHFYRLAHGQDDRPVRVSDEVKSVSNEHTFGQDIDDIDFIRQKLVYLCEKVGYRLRKKQLKGRTIHLKLRYHDFSTITRNLTINQATNQTRQIVDVVLDLFEKNYMPGRKVRLVGVGVSGFDLKESRQISLFDILEEKQNKLDQVQDQLSNRFGRHIAQRAESLSPKKTK